MSYEPEIPYGAYWSSPFARWQGSLSHLHSMKFAAHTAKKELANRKISHDEIDNGILGLTVPQKQSFYGLPWVTGMMGAGDVTGPTINQACATGARILTSAYQEVKSGFSDTTLILSTDRTSNGAHVYYPAPKNPGGSGAHENVVMDNFNHDPYAKNAMIDTAENIAAKYQISTQEQHNLVLRRYEQYKEALSNECAFQKRYMSLPFDVPDNRYCKTISTLTSDEGIIEADVESLAKLTPVKAGGTITFGGQTHPADGTVGLIVTTQDKAQRYSKDPSIQIRLLGFGQSRTEKGYMPEAPVEATQRALNNATMGIKNVDTVKSHNPFAVNDIVFSRETGFNIDDMNNYGCSLIWGHPQGPTGLRSIIELIEELTLKGGGRGLFQGCAAGDSAIALVLEVRDRIY